MSNHIPVAAKLQGLLDHPVCFPLKCAFTPLICLAEKINHLIQGFLGYFVELGVFSFGAWNKSWIKQKIIELYKGGCYDTHDRSRFDPNRLKAAFRIMKDMGGIRSHTYTKDGTKLDTMIVRYKDVKKRIEEMGGKIVSNYPITIQNVKKKGKTTIYMCKEHTSQPEEFVDIIIPDPSNQRDFGKWKRFLKFSDTTLSNIGLEIIKIFREEGTKTEGFIVKHWKQKNPKRPKEKQCFVLCNSPTESFAMAKKNIFRHVLGLHCDMLCFDYRGTWKSKGTPSEGGYYLDAEAMVEKAIHIYGYKVPNIWATGFCLGGSIAAHLKRKYHDQGINFFVQNTYDKMAHTLKQQIWPASLLAPYALPALRSNDPNVYSNVQEDDFDTIKKLESCQRNDKNMNIIVNTSTDRTICPNSHVHLSATAEATGKTFSHLFHPKSTRNGHSLDVLGERIIWDKVVDEITFKDDPTIFQPNKKPNANSWLSWLTRIRVN